MAQSREDVLAIAMQQEVSELESLVAAACARGVDAARCRGVIEDAVRRARRRAGMLPHLDSSLLLSTLEQAKSEIASLSDAAATNAEVMKEELLHHRERAEERAATSSEDVAAASVQSLPATITSQLVPGAGQGDDDASTSARSDSQAPIATPSHLPTSSLTAADAVAPMRDFASDVATEAAAEADEDRFFRQALTMKACTSGHFRVAQSYDFEKAVSPRAAYHDQEEPNRFCPSPGNGGSSMWQPLEGEEEAEELLVYRRGSPLSRQNMEAGEEEQEGEEASVAEHAPAASAGSWPWPAAAQPQGISCGGTPCCSIPPGLNPMATVEGGLEHGSEWDSLRPRSPTTGMGQLGLRSYSEEAFALHTDTPPRHVMAELAAEVAGRLRL